MQKIDLYVNDFAIMRILIGFTGEKQNGTSKPL